MPRRMLFRNGRYLFKGGRYISYQPPDLGAPASTLLPAEITITEGVAGSATLVPSGGNPDSYTITTSTPPTGMTFDGVDTLNWDTSFTTGSSIPAIDITVDNGVGDPVVFSRSISVVSASPAIYTINLANQAASPAPGYYRFGIVLDPDDLSPGERLVAKKADGTSLRCALIDKVTYSNGSVHVAGVLLQCPLDSSANSDVTLHAQAGSQPAPTFTVNDLKTFIAALPATELRLTNQLGFLRGPLPDQTFNLQTAAASPKYAEWLEVRESTELGVCAEVIQKIPGEEQLHVRWYFETIWKNSSGDIVANECAITVYQPFGVDNPYGVTQTRELRRFTAGLYVGGDLVQSYTDGQSLSVTETFDSTTGWATGTASGGWIITGGKLRVNTPTTAGYREIIRTTETLKKFAIVKCDITISEYTQGSVFLEVGSGNEATELFTPNVSGNGTHTVYLATTAETTYMVRHNGTFIGAIDSITFTVNPGIQVGTNCPGTILNDLADNDTRHVEPHWFNISSTVRSDIHHTHSSATKEKIRRNWLIGPVDVTDTTLIDEQGSNYSMVRRMMPGQNLGGRAGGLAQGGGYAARTPSGSWRTVLSFMRETPEYVCKDRVYASAQGTITGLLYDHRPRGGVVYHRLIPGPVKSLGTPTYAGLGTILVAGPDPSYTLNTGQPAGGNPGGWFNSADTEHHHSICHYAAWRRCSKQFRDMTLGVADWLRRTSAYNSSGADRPPLYWEKRATGTTPYGQIFYHGQERFGQGLWTVGHAMAICPDADPHRQMFFDFTKHYANFLKAGYDFFPQAQKDAGIVNTYPVFTGKQWMSSLTAFGLYMLWANSEPVPNRIEIWKMAHVAAQRTINKWRHAAQMVVEYTDNTGQLDGTAVNYAEKTEPLLDIPGAVSGDVLTLTIPSGYTLQNNDTLYFSGYGVESLSPAPGYPPPGLSQAVKYKAQVVSGNTCQIYLNGSRVTGITNKTGMRVGIFFQSANTVTSLGNLAQDTYAAIAKALVHIAAEAGHPDIDQTFMDRVASLTAAFDGVITAGWEYKTTKFT